MIKHWNSASLRSKHIDATVWSRGIDATHKVPHEYVGIKLNFKGSLYKKDLISLRRFLDKVIKQTY